MAIKTRSRVETQLRFKIQYPMKNRYKDAVKKPNAAPESKLFIKNTINRV
jgi:hypothetical protein